MKDAFTNASASLKQPPYSFIVAFNISNIGNVSASNFVVEVRAQGAVSIHVRQIKVLAVRHPAHSPFRPPESSTRKTKAGPTINVEYRCMTLSS